ncbi:hypothetical protein DL96DRAFT_1529524 [Flagelloscypha sp. PMI_526]|nr:hypothetical protein DL96DRAFT_1529524 [Flagelloscypha sp. PMI_526]
MFLQRASKNAKKAIETPTLKKRIDLDIPAEYKVSGMKLPSLTQALAHKSITEKMRKNLRKRRRTKENLSLTRHATYDANESLPADENLWLSLRNKDLSRNIRYFLWMTMHDAYMVGDKWLRPSMSAELQERAICKHCDSVEDMDHILTSCSAVGQGTLWQLAEQLWEQTGEGWNDLSLGLILGAPAIQMRNQGTNRLFRILITETAHMAWKLRCERVIDNENKDFTVAEVRNRWIHAILLRIQHDVALTDKGRYEKKALPKRTVHETWAKVLHTEGENYLKRDWMSQGVGLVGIRAA